MLSPAVLALCVCLLWHSKSISIAAHDVPDEYEQEAHMQMKALRLQTIKEEILAELRYTAPPNVSAMVQPMLLQMAVMEMNAVSDAPQVISRSQALSLGDEPVVLRRTASGDLLGSGTERQKRASMKSITSKQLIMPITPTEDSLAHKTRFNLSSLEVHEVHNATLHFQLRHPVHGAADPFKHVVHVYQFIDELQLRTEPSVQLLRESRSGWHSIDVSGVVREWLKAQHKNFGLMLKAQLVSDERPSTDNSYDAELDLVHRRADDVHDIDHQPVFLEVGMSKMITSEDYLKQLSRDTADCELDANDFRQSCCRYPLKVNFDEIGFDFIVAPKSFDAYYCRGTCNTGGQQDSVYQHFREQSRLAGNTNVPEQCCVPTQRSAVDVVYLDMQGNYKKRQLANLRADSCGCN